MGWARCQLIVAFIWIIYDGSICNGSVQADPNHVIFAFVDHFEPHGSAEEVNQQTRIWVDDYIHLANRHADIDNRHPIHSYFLLSWPYIQLEHLNNALYILNQVTYTGYGEIEFHCHHGRPDEGLRTEQEVADELLDIIKLAKQQFNMHGALLTAETQPKITCGFIHGMWALDNSRFNTWGDTPHYEWCGVNREMDILHREGVYADFTFPAPLPMDSTIHDLIYYAVDDNYPASYQNLSNVYPVEVNAPPMDSLMIIQGPNVRTNISVVPDVYYDWPTLSRMNSWVKHKVHVLGNDKWIFVKVYTHGLGCDLNDPDSWDCYFGRSMDNFYSDIEKKYNDGINWKLHYVSAREMYNIVKAAEAGKTGDPNSYRDFTIPPYANMVIFTQNQYRLLRYDVGGIWIEMLDNSVMVDMSLKRYNTEAIILESGKKGGPIYLSDANRDSGQFGELHLIDNTPSKFYYIIK